MRRAHHDEMVSWGSTLKYWREPILNYFDRPTTNCFTEGCNTKINMLKRASYGIMKCKGLLEKIAARFCTGPKLFPQHVTKSPDAIDRSLTCNIDLMQGGDYVLL
ncbi:MAG: transposase [Dehalococcoidia bacterium]